jgi:predicted small metal-binding protein
VSAPGAMPSVRDLVVAMPKHDDYIDYSVGARCLPCAFDVRAVNAHLVAAQMAQHLEAVHTGVFDLEAARLDVLDLVRRSPSCATQQEPAGATIMSQDGPAVVREVVRGLAASVLRCTACGVKVGGVRDDELVEQMARHLGFSHQFGATEARTASLGASFVDLEDGGEGRGVEGASAGSEAKVRVPVKGSATPRVESAAPSPIVAPPVVPEPRSEKSGEILIGNPSSISTPGGADPYAGVDVSLARIRSGEKPLGARVEEAPAVADRDPLMTVLGEILAEVRRIRVHGIGG